MNIPKYRRRSIIPSKGSIPRGKFKRPQSIREPIIQFEVVRDTELEAEIKAYKEANNE